MQFDCCHAFAYVSMRLSGLLDYFAYSNEISVLVGFEKEVPIQHHQRYCTNSPSVHHGSVGVLAAARIRRESFTWNHSSLVLLCVSVGCG